MRNKEVDCSMTPTTSAVEKVLAARMSRCEEGIGGEKGAHVIEVMSMQRNVPLMTRILGHAVERDIGRSGHSCAARADPDVERELAEVVCHFKNVRNTAPGNHCSQRRAHRSFRRSQMEHASCAARS